MGAADLDDVLPGLGLRIDRIAQRHHRWKQALLHIDGRRDIHRRRKGIVRRLRHVDVIVGVDRRFAAEWRPRELAAPVRDHLVHVHVELRAAARHPDVQGEHVVMLPCEDLVARLNDQAISLVIQTPAGMVGGGSRLLQDRVGGDHLARDQILADTEVLERALSLGTPQLVGRDVDHAEAICFLPGGGHMISPRFNVQCS